MTHFKYLVQWKVKWISLSRSTSVKQSKYGTLFKSKNLSLELIDAYVLCSAFQKPEST